MKISTKATLVDYTFLGIISLLIGFSNHAIVFLIRGRILSESIHVLGKETRQREVEPKKVTFKGRCSEAALLK